MRVESLSGTNARPPIGGVYAVGNFDGVHLGHRRLFHRCREIAGDAPTAAFTFSGLSKGSTSLFCESDKTALLFEAGAEYSVTEDFSEIRALAPEEFVDGYLVPLLHPSAVVCGEDFRFGRGGAGDASLLASLLERRGVLLSIVPTVCEGGDAVSTTRIKRCLAEGRAEEASRLLGQDYFITYTAEHGAHLGSSIGFPTANGRIPEGIALPRFGVYAGSVQTVRGTYPCVLNVGVKPTVVTGGGVTVETHAIGLTGELYGSRVRVTLGRFIRPEMKFESVEALREQIRKDTEAALRFGDVK